MLTWRLERGFQVRALGPPLKILGVVALSNVERTRRYRPEPSYLDFWKCARVWLIGPVLKTEGGTHSARGFESLHFLYRTYDVVVALLIACEEAPVQIRIGA